MSSDNINFKILSEQLYSAYLYAEAGLPEETFRYITSVTPILNVDLLIRDQSGRFLLSWRDDDEGMGWHIPGGIVRYKESLNDRIYKTAMSEIGTPLSHGENPDKISQSFSSRRIRGHFISFLYICHFQDQSYDIASFNGFKKEYDCGYLKWHDKCPDDILEIHRKLYADYFTMCIC